MLNSYATPNTKFEGLDLKTSKISKLFTFCLFTLVFGIESKKLQEIFRRYEIKKIELTDEAIVTLNSYWENLVDAKRMPFVDRAKFENYIENLMYVTSKICTDDINGDNVYKAILKYWDMIVCFKIDGKLLAYLLSRLQPNNENITSILDKLTSNLETYERFGDCYEWMAHYLSKQKTTYDLDLSKLTEGKFAKELRHLYKIIEPSKGNNVVIVSLARAGTPLGILIRRYIRNKYNGYLQLRFPGTTDHDGGGIAITPKNASIKITSITVSLNSRTFALYSSGISTSCGSS